MLLSVTSRPGISTFGYNKNNKKPYVSLSQQMAPPSPSSSTPNSSSGSNGNDQLSKTNLYIRGLQPGTTDQDLVKLCQSMESTEKCEAIITHFNGKYIKTPAGVPAPSDPLLCKFADGGPKKRQNQGKYVQNGRAWPRNGDMGGMALTYDPTTALQNGFYPAPYNITPNRMLAQSALSPYLPSPVSSYQRVTQTSPLQVPNPSWMHHQSYLMQPSGSVLPPGMDHPISLQPASMMGPLTQQLGHLSLSSTGTYLPPAATVPGAYISQYAPVAASSVSAEAALVGRARRIAQLDPRALAVVQESGSQQNPVPVDAPSDHGLYSFQFNK
ncbi:RNA-binding motif, single-stranded-interacting protein 2 isoform X4 [Canis lupus dingo]|uniref:RNA-binding motif, single-stranded-interacting protein 2 isoform X4 n=1 Tax=Canis lupus dingo TaxID=286419 RepID=UPI000DC6740E|nr:RNA-binding motif, single-stranded-interacting protein 2 isoform X4 [Canis lupus dingo]